MQRELHGRHSHHADGNSKLRIDVRGMVRRVQWHGQLQPDGIGHDIGYSYVQYRHGQ